MSTSWPGGIISKTAVVPAGPYQDGAASGMWTLDQAAAYTKQGIWPLAGNLRVIDTLFSAYTFTGTNTLQTLTTGIDISTKGGLIWTKSRSAANGHYLYDTTRATYAYLATDTTGAVVTGLPDYNVVPTTTGMTISATQAGINTSGTTSVAWSFAQGDKFFKMAQVTVSGSNQTVDLSSLGTVGMVTVKRTDSTSDWYTWHRSLTAGNLVYLNTTAAQAASAAISVSGTTLTLTQATIGNGTYIVYAWAHDAATDGMIQCGVVNAVDTVVTLGWEPQFVLYKSTTTAYDWQTFDTARGYTAPNGNSQVLAPNSTSAESTTSSNNITATGCVISDYSPNTPRIYMAIRRPMKVPTLGTQVYNAIARTGTGAAETITGVGFPPDLAVVKKRSSSTLTGATWQDRLRGATQYLLSTTTDYELTQSQSITSFNMDGMSVGTFTNENASTHTYINWYFRRYPSVFDEVCYTGTGTDRTVAHNLGVTPELIIFKSRSATYNWVVISNITASDATNTFLNLTDAGGSAGYYSGGFFYAQPSAFVLPLSTYSTNGINNSGQTYVAYLFATLAGVSKVGSYTGNGSSLTINAGFTTGARFVLIKRADSTGDWFTWDSTRGIVAGNDPHLSLNTTAAEVTTDDSIDPDNSGFIVNQVAATNINVTSATYIYLAFS